MKGPVSAILLSVLLLNFFGVLPVFYVLQQNIRSEVKSKIKAGIPESELHKISFSKNEKIDLVEGKQGKEVRKSGDFYDIVRTEVVNGEIVYYGINDKEEKALFENLDNLCQKEQNGSPVNKTIKDFFKNFSQSLLLHYTPFVLNLESIFSFQTTDYLLLTTSFPPPTPPPNC